MTVLSAMLDFDSPPYLTLPHILIGVAFIKLIALCETVQNYILV